MVIDWLISMRLINLYSYLYALLSYMQKGRSARKLIFFAGIFGSPYIEIIVLLLKRFFDIEKYRNTVILVAFALRSSS